MEGLKFFLREFLEVIFLALYFEKFSGKSASEQIKVVRDAILRIPEQKLTDTIKELQRTYSRSHTQKEFKENLKKYSDKILFFKKRNALPADKPAGKKGVHADL